MAMKDGRMKWRHDSLLTHLVETLKQQKPDMTETEIFADFPPDNINGGTVPGDIIATLKRPDIVLINRTLKKITLIEITVPFEENSNRAQKRKQLSYIDLVDDLKKSGLKTEGFPFEVGARGLILNEAKKTLMKALQHATIKISMKRVFANMSKGADRKYFSYACSCSRLMYVYQ